jgi:hypothetical protein
LNSVTRCRPVLARRSAFNPARRPACLLTRRPARGSRLDSSVPNILLLSCHGIDRPPPLRRGRRRPPHPPSRGVPRPLQHAGHHPPLLPRDRLGPLPCVAAIGNLSLLLLLDDRRRPPPCSTEHAPERRSLPSTASGQRAAARAVLNSPCSPAWTPQVLALTSSVL